MVVPWVGFPFRNLLSSVSLCRRQNMFDFFPFIADLGAMLDDGKSPEGFRAGRCSTFSHLSLKPEAAFAAR